MITTVPAGYMFLKSKYLYAVEATPYGRKTRVIQVRARSSDTILGEIRWWGPWRQYVFAPEVDTVFNVGCMSEIAAEITALMDERKSAHNSEKDAG